MEFKQVVGILKAKWRLVALVSLLVTTAVGAYSYLYWQPVYEASAKLILSNESSGGDSLSYNSLLANGMLIQTYKQIVKTPRLMDRVAQAHPELRMTSGELIARVNAQTTDNQIMSIVVQDPSYEKAADIANAVAGVMLTEIPRIVKMNNLFLLDEAQDYPEPVPVNMSPGLKTAIALFLSLLLGSGIALFRDYMDDRVRTIGQIERAAGIAALAALPRVRKAEVYPLIRLAPEEAKGDQSYVTVSP